MSDIPIRELKGHDILAVERFQDGTSHMIEFVVRKDGTPYPEFPEIRREMRDLQMARANVTQLMGYEEKPQEREKEKEAGETERDSL